jgi:hypothetical protein
VTARLSSGASGSGSAGAGSSHDPPSSGAALLSAVLGLPLPSSSTGAAGGSTLGSGGRSGQSMSDLLGSLFGPLAALDALSRAAGHGPLRLPGVLRGERAEEDAGPSGSSPASSRGRAGLGPGFGGGIGSGRGALLIRTGGDGESGAWFLGLPNATGSISAIRLGPGAGLFGGLGAVGDWADVDTLTYDRWVAAHRAAAGGPGGSSARRASSQTS